jgi:hypothetical protein
MSNEKKKYCKVKDGGVYASDVDDTLIMWRIPEGYEGELVETEVFGFKDKGIPNKPAIEHLKKMKARGYSVVVWSAGGSDWAEAVVKALKLEEYVDVVMPKIDFHLDDNADPTDKIGKWQFINLDGDVYSKDKDGNVKKRTDGIIQPYGGLFDEKRSKN